MIADAESPHAVLAGICRRPLPLLAATGCICWLAYVAIAVLSRQFVYGEGHTERPILLVLGIFGLAFGCYLAAIWMAVRARPNWRLLGLILAGSVLFRITLLFTQPIQEIDIYRYIWDGEVAVRGISPFRYSPQQVLEASPDEVLPDDLRRLVEVRDSSPAVATILSRIHYEELPTIYPPVSQCVFAFSSLVTPGDAGVFQRLTTMKTCIMFFDLATLGVVIGLLRFAGKHVGWSVAYGWCPLVIKEIANSGHLDAVAVFLASAALLIAVWATMRRSSFGATGGSMLASCLLALAVGAKLYPLVLFPLLFFIFLRRLGWLSSSVSTIIFSVTVALVLWPMIPSTNKPIEPAVADAEIATSDLPPLPADDTAAPAVDPQDPSLGLKTFLGRWEMNDFLFLVLVENVKSDGKRPPKQRPWSVIVPQSVRGQLAQGLSERLHIRPKAASFLLARSVTGILFLGLALLLAWRAAGSGRPQDWLGAAFLTVAWFWLLSPTQNPWYWVWAMPLVAFGRSKVWLLVSGVTMIYYLRFWLGYHWPEDAVPGTTYHGKLFFDYVVTCLEFGPLLLLLAVDTWRHGRVGGSCREDAGVAPSNATRVEPISNRHSKTVSRELIIFTRYPEPGKTKTRLIPALGSWGAAALHRAMTRHTLRWAGELAEQGALAVGVHYEGGTENLMRQCFGSQFTYLAQPEGDLGQRLSRAFVESFRAGRKRTVVVGTDCPRLSASLAAEAFDGLGENDLVIGPADDGGYYLIGLRRDVPRLFAQIPWGTDRVLEATLGTAAKLDLSVCLLKTLSDVDRPEDLAVWDRAKTEAWNSCTEGRISVIIPTFDEKDELLGETLHGARCGFCVETIVVDAGGCDSTRRVTEAAGARFAISARGKGRQMNAGAALATGDVLLFLHADTQLPDDFERHVSETLSSPRVVAGAFRLQIKGASGSLCVIQQAANIRSRFLQMPYGDQALFLPADTFRDLRGFREMPIMEDFELVRRLRRIGRVAIAPANAITSARRWKELGAWRTTIINQLIVAGYCLRVPPDSLARWYHGKPND